MSMSGAVRTQRNRSHLVPAEPRTATQSAAPHQRLSVPPHRSRPCRAARMLDVPRLRRLFEPDRQPRCPSRSAAARALGSARGALRTAGARDLRALADRNETRVQMIGLGYSDTITPAVLRRNMLESPAWYTAYTPYQPEISQGRLEALLTFQTVIEDLTALPLAGASLLDEATAVMEAVLLMRRANKRSPPPTASSLDADCLPQTLAVVRGRAKAVGIEVVVADLSGELPDGDMFGVVFQAPGASGAVRDLAPLIAAANDRGALTTVAADLLSLTLLSPARRAGRRHRGRLGAAFRCAAVLRRTARRLHGRARRVRAHAARPAGRSIASTSTANPPTGWRCRPANSTSAGTRRPATSAPRRRCSPTSPPCTPPTTARKGCAPSQTGCMVTPPTSPQGCAPPATTVVHDAVLRHRHGAGPGGADRSCRPPTTRHQPAPGRRRPRRHLLRRVHHRRHGPPGARGRSVPHRPIRRRCVRSCRRHCFGRRTT